MIFVRLGCWRDRGAPVAMLHSTIQQQALGNIKIGDHEFERSNGPAACPLMSFNEFTGAVRDRALKTSH
jgi:hypothetical protein